VTQLPDSPPRTDPERRPHDRRRWHLLLIVAVSSLWESRFILKGSNLLDEGWALYAGMQLHQGRSLYDDICWVFPPGHALPAFVGFGLDPHGVVVPRLIYAAFTVALCVALYELGRRLTPATFALLGALLLAVAAPRSHMMHLLYGYRYMVWAVLVLLAFSKRLDSGQRRWMFVAGMLAGISLAFRVTPAFAVSCGVGVAVLTIGSWRSWLRDWSLYAAGLLLVMAPVLAWFGASVGLERVWREVILHPVAMLQPLPVPELIAPATWDREAITEAWRPLSLRLFLLLYLGYAVALLGSWIRSGLRGAAYPHGLLLALVVWGGVFFVRSFGRADEAHMDTTLPPICLLLAHLLGLCVRRFAPEAGGSRRLAVPAACAVALAAWVFLLGSDRYLRARHFAHLGLPTKLTSSVAVIERHTRSGDILLDLTAAPMFHALTNRPGPGRSDVVMEGTFMDDEEELQFIRLLEQSPPVAVLWPIRHFDDMPSRSIERVAPRVSAWVRSRYAPVEVSAKFRLLLPREQAKRP
jgi:hypothetical protein